MTDDTSFAQLVSLACHDLRTPLATVNGFAITLARSPGADGQTERYVELIKAASEQLTELVDDLALAARIEGGRYDPPLRDADTLDLARAAAARVGDGVVASVAGTRVVVDPDAAARALSGLARCALRHGPLDRVELAAAGAELTLAPVPPPVYPIILGDDLRDFGAAVGVRALEALGASVVPAAERLVIRLPS